MSAPSSGNSWKSGDGVSDQFPAGLRVLVVDDDPTCLRILEKMLRNCLYEVTKCNKAEIALRFLRDNKNGFDIVISDVHMPDMDGFKLLEQVGLEMDLPVIMMSADDSKNVVMKGVTHGACDYLIKPVRMEALKNIWQHVVRKKRHEWKDKDLEQSASVVEDGERKQRPEEDIDYSSPANEGNWKTSRKRKDEEDEVDEKDDTSTLKKPRVVWSVELHQQFVAAVNQLGIDKAVPKKILELMNVPGLTRENVASHLQKYRLYLRRLSGISQHQNGLNSSYMAPDVSFASMSSLHGFDFQALGTSQIPVQSLASLQAAALSRPSSKSPVSVPVDQKNLFSFECPKIRFSEGQPQLGSNTDQMNLLHGIPTNMEPKQLVTLNQSAQSLCSMSVQLSSQAIQNNPLVAPITQPVSRAQMPNESNASSASTEPSPVGHSMLLNAISSGSLARSGSASGICGMLYTPTSQASSVVDFSLNAGSQLPGHSFPHARNAGISSLTSQGLLQGDVNLEAKGSRGFVPSSGYFSEFQHYKSHDWGSQDVGPTFDASPHPIVRGSVEVPPLTFVQPGFSSVQKNGQNRAVEAIFSRGEGGQNSFANSVLPFNPFMADGSQRVKVETFQDSSCPSNLFSQQFGQDDILSALLKQQDSNGSIGAEFGFDGYPLDNLPA